MKKENKKVLFIVGAIALVVAAIIGYLVFKDFGQEDALKKEVEVLNKLDVTKDRYNTPIKTRGNYATVEKAIKGYLDDYAVTLQKTLKLLKENGLEKILTIDNMKKDGKEFKESLTFLTTFKKDFNTTIDKVISLTSEKTMLSYIEKEKLSKSYNDLYKELVLGGIDASFFDSEKKQLEASKLKINNLIATEEKALKFLIENKDSWEIQGNNLMFQEQSLADAYNKIIKGLS